MLLLTVLTLVPSVSKRAASPTHTTHLRVQNVVYRIPGFMWGGLAPRWRRVNRLSPDGLLIRGPLADGCAGFIGSRPGPTSDKSSSRFCSSRASCATNSSCRLWPKCLRQGQSPRAFPKKEEPSADTKDRGMRGLLLGVTPRPCCYSDSLGFYSNVPNEPTQRSMGTSKRPHSASSSIQGP